MYRSRVDNGYITSTPKNGRSRIISPAPYVMDMLQKRYDEQIEDAKTAGASWIAWRNEREHQCAFVFTNKEGDYLRPKKIYLHFKTITTKINTQITRVHDLRHTFAVLSIQNGDDLKTVQENLGHSTASFTLDVYGHVNDKMRKESAKRMQNYIHDINLNKG